MPGPDDANAPGVDGSPPGRAGRPEFKELNADIKDFVQKTTKKPELKLDGTKTNMIAKRSDEWNKDSVWPLMDTSTNSSCEEWLTKEAIRGQRILVHKGGSSSWRWRILVAKNDRSESVMRAWLKEHAEDLSAEEWDRKYPGTDQAKAKKDVKRPDWEIHHVVPLYVGDAGANYILLDLSDRRTTHGSRGAIFKTWGTPRPYCTRGSEFADVTSTGDDWPASRRPCRYG